MNETRAVGVAGLAHLAIIVALSVSFSRMQPPALLPAPEAIVVDLSEIAEVAKATGEPATPAPAEERAPATVAPPPPPPEEAPPAPPEVARPEPPPVAPPEPAPADETPPPQPVARSAPAERFEKLPESARVETKPAVKPKPDTPPKRLSDILADAIGPDTPVAKPGPAPVSPDLRKGAPSPARADLGAKAVATLAQAIRSQIYPCWNPPSGRDGALTVTLRVRLDRKGAVVGLPEVTGGTGTASDAVRRAFDESARRAVLRCTPLQLPSDLYSLWSDIELNFDPRDITQ